MDVTEAGEQSEETTGLDFQGSDRSDSSSESEDSSGQPESMVTNEGELVATLSIQGTVRAPQFTESLLSLLHLILVEHVGMPYLGRIPGQGEDTASPTMLSFANVALRLQRNLAISMKNLMRCTHVGMDAAISLQDDCECNSEMRTALMSMQDANPVLETFCLELLKGRRPFCSRLSSMIISLADLLICHVEVAKNFFVEFDNNCGDDIKDYWNKYGLINSTGADAIVDDDVETGIWFPGRSQCRPGIIFTSKDVRHCRKKYTKSQRHSSGILTVQCACQSPKLLGFILMTRAESVSLALSSFLTQLPILPRTIYYHNACNMFSSAMLRVPWIFKQNRMAVDRFHYKSHKCNALFNPDSCSNLDTHRTETAESINARIEKSLPYMRYLGSDNLLPFLRARLSLINLCALYQQRFNRSDLEDEDLTRFFQESCNCDCILCESNEIELKLERDERRQRELEDQLLLEQRRQRAAKRALTGANTCDADQRAGEAVPGTENAEGESGQMVQRATQS